MANYKLMYEDLEDSSRAEISRLKKLITELVKLNANLHADCARYQSRLDSLEYALHLMHQQVRAFRQPAIDREAETKTKEILEHRDEVKLAT